MGRLTLTEARSQLRGIGYSVKSREGEYIVGKTGQPEGDGTYYTNDLQDAVNTAWAMYHRRHGASPMPRTTRRNPRESVASESMLTHITPGNGKFGGMPAAVEFAYNKIGEGWSHEEVGGDETGFNWTALIVNVPFGRKLASFIISEDPYGFVYAKMYDDAKQAERAWNKVAAAYDEHMEGEEDDDEG